MSDQPRRYRNVLPLQEKLTVLNKIAEGRTYASLARDYGVSITSIRSVKKCEAKIRAISKLVSNPVASRTCLRRDTNVEKMEQLLLKRIDEADSEGRPYKPLRARREAMEIMRKLNPADVKFRATKGWYQRFRKRCRQLNDEELAAKFSALLERTVDEELLSAERVYSVGEVELQWKPCERLRLLLCCNSTGDHKVVGEAWPDLKRALVLVRVGLEPRIPGSKILKIPEQIDHLVSPMSQGATEIFKLYYYNLLMEHLQKSKQTWSDLECERARVLAAEAWREVQEETIRVCWSKVLGKSTRGIGKELEAKKEKIFGMAEVIGGEDFTATVKRVVLDGAGHRVEEISDDITMNSCTTEDSVDNSECHIKSEVSVDIAEPCASTSLDDSSTCDIKTEVDVEDTEIIADSSEPTTTTTNTGRFGDDFDLFGELVARKIRRLSTRYAQCTVQHLINNVLYEAEMGVHDKPFGSPLL